MEESRYVFLEKSGFLDSVSQGVSAVTVAELGFGTGLNFLLTAKAWLDSAPLPSRKLQFISFEKYPLSKSELFSVHQKWESLTPLSEKLLADWPEAIGDLEQIEVGCFGVSLVVYLGDAKSSLEKVTFQADHWYLDGFTPSKNPDLWSPEIAQQLANHSHDETRIATYSAAGWVRRTLEGEGFFLEKEKGFGRKRHMLCGGRKPKQGMAAPILAPYQWRHGVRDHAFERVAVIGSGFAGSSIANQLASRGSDLLLLDRHSRPAMEASGNARALYVPLLRDAENRGSRFSKIAFAKLLENFDRLESKGLYFDRSETGVLELPRRQEHETMLQGALQGLNGSMEGNWVTASEASAIAGIPISSEGLFHPRAGALNPRKYCQALLQEFPERIRWFPEFDVQEISEGSRSIRITSQKGDSVEVDTVVLANAYEVRKWVPSLPLRALGGRLAEVESTDESRKLKVPLSWERYVLPAHDGAHVFGATHERMRDEEVRYRSKQARLEVPNESNWALIMGDLETHLPENFFGASPAFRTRWSMRATTADSLPFVGSIVDEKSFRENFENWHLGPHHQVWSKPEYRAGMFMLTGLGGRGLVSSAFASELLAEMIFGIQNPAHAEWLTLLSPSRALLRELQRPPIHRGRWQNNSVPSDTIHP